MSKKLYTLYGVNTAMDLLRPGARWQITNGFFDIWEDPRPCPTIEEVLDVMEKIKQFEDTIPTLWKDDLVNNVNTNEVQNMNTTQTVNLISTQIPSISTQQVAALSTTQIPSISTSQI
jgi:hypothetical protein